MSRLFSICRRAMRTLRPWLLAVIAALAVVSLACRVSDEPNRNKAVGMIGNWSVSPATIDEAGNGRGSCAVTPDFTMTVDSGPPGMSVSIPTAESLVCRAAAVTTYPLTLSDSLAVLDAGAGPQHAVVFYVTAAPQELVAFAWPDITGDSIGGILVNIDTAAAVVAGQTSWTAVRP